MEDSRACSKCKQIKKPSDFPKCKTCKDGLMRQCKACCNENARNRYANDSLYREAVKARVRVRYATDEGYRQRCNEYTKAYFQQQLAIDPDTTRKKASERTMTDYYGAKDGSLEERRRARQQQREGVFSADDIINILKNQENKCAYCSADISQRRHMDHIVPLSRGGSNHPSNIVLTCPTCNLSKNASLPQEWEVRKTSKAG